mgnify:CR=1 FL=1
MHEIVEVRDLTKRYGDLTAVDHVSFAVRTGEVFGLLGPNGAGKTTTLECIEGMRAFDGGVITVAGVDVRRDEKAVRRSLGVQLQASALPGDIRPEEAMALVCGWHGVPVRRDLLDRFGMGEMSKKTYAQMSTGQKRRLHLALALAADPAVVVLDEPTAGLDVEGRAQLHGAIRELKESGMTFLLATHDMAEAEMLCDRIAIIIRGRLITLGTPAQVTAAGSQETKITIHTEKNSLLPGQDTPHARFIAEREGYGVWASAQVSRAVPALLKTIEDCGDKVIDLRVERPSLEERFLEIVGTEEKAI